MESLVTTSPSTNGVGTPAFPTIDPNIVVEYLAKVLEISLGASRKELESPGSLLSKSRYSETVQRCTRFATESQLALYVQKESVLEDAEDGVIDTSSMYLLLMDFWLLLTLCRSGII